MLNPLRGSHNSFLDMAYRVGILGLMVLLAMPVLLLTKAREVCRRDLNGKKVLLVTTCTCLLSILVYASFNVVFDTPYLSLFFWTMLGIGAGALADPQVSDGRRSPSGCA
jgi:O-antigen ligase